MDATVGVDDVTNESTPFADMNIWAYREGTPPVPEPGTAVSGLISAVMAVGYGRRRRAG